MRCRLIAFATMALTVTTAYGVTLDLGGAIARALQTDPRIAEQQHLVRAAEALVQEATASNGLRIEINTFLGLAPGLEGGIFTNNSNTCGIGGCTLRNDAGSLDGVGAWAGLEFTLIKPLYTFGKIEHYTAAASGQVAIREGNVALQRAATSRQVVQAYYGYLAARDATGLLADVDARITSAVELAQRWIEEGREGIILSDLYSLQTGQGIVRHNLAQAHSIEQIAYQGLRLLTGVAPDEVLEVADRYNRPVRFELEPIDVLQRRAIRQRPEMGQLEAGLHARRALVEAKRAEKLPNIYAGLVGGVSVSSGRDDLKNPHVYDPFNYIAATPVVGMQWSWSGGVQAARIAREQAELDALLDKAAFARQGIPYEVTEWRYRVVALQVAVRELASASRSARRWMLAVYADFEAGFEDAREVFDAFQAYVLAHAEYISAVNDHNVGVAELRRVTGDAL